MDSKEILKAIDPKGAEIEKLQREIQVAKQRYEMVSTELNKANEDKRKLRWLKEHGILLETPDGMRYLKEEEFDEFLSNLPDFGGITKRLAESMQRTKEAVAGKILNKIFEEEYTEQSEQLAKELLNGTDTGKKGKRRSN